MLWVVLGDYGSGKTLFLVLEGFSSNREILGNFSLDLNNYTRIDPMDLGKIGSNKLILLDEMQTWLESRISMSFLNRFITNIIDQTDKRDIDVFGSAHLFGSLDIRFRLNVHRVVYCERIGDVDESRTRKYDTRDFKYSILNTYSGKIIKKKFKYEKAERYFPYYETKEIIQYPNQKDLELDLMLKHDPTKAFERLMEIAESLKSNGGITHSTIELSLLKNGYSPKHSRLIYACLKKLGKNEKLQE